MTSMAGVEKLEELPSFVSKPKAAFSVPHTAAELAKNGFTLDESTAKYKGEKMVAVYLKQEFGGFAVHLLQK